MGMILNTLFEMGALTNCVYQHALGWNSRLCEKGKRAEHQHPLLSVT